MPADQQRVLAGKYQRAGLRVAPACLAAELSLVGATATAPARVVAAELGAIPRAPVLVLATYGLLAAPRDTPAVPDMARFSADGKNRTALLSAQVCPA